MSIYGYIPVYVDDFETRMMIFHFWADFDDFFIFGQILMIFLIFGSILMIFGAWVHVL